MQTASGDCVSCWLRAPGPCGGAQGKAAKDALNESSSFPAGPASWGSGRKPVCLSACLSREELWLCCAAEADSQRSPRVSFPIANPVSGQCPEGRTRGAQTCREVRVGGARAFLEQNYSVDGTVWTVGQLSARSCVLLRLSSLCSSTGAAFFFFSAVLRDVQHSRARTARPVSSCMVWWW